MALHASCHRHAPHSPGVTDRCRHVDQARRPDTSLCAVGPALHRYGVLSGSRLRLCWSWGRGTVKCHAKRLGRRGVCTKVKAVSGAAVQIAIRKDRRDVALERLGSRREEADLTRASTGRAPQDGVGAAGRDTIQIAQSTDDIESDLRRRRAGECDASTWGGWA